MNLRILTFLYFFVYYSTGYSITSDKVIIEQTSDSKRTIQINRGYLDKIGDSDLGYLIKPEKLPVGKVIMRPIAKIRALKVYPKNSIWIAINIYEGHLLNSGDKLTLLSQTKFLQGRKSLNIQRQNVVLNKDQNENSMLVGAESLTIKESEFEVSDKVHGVEKHYDSLVDVQVIDIEKWDPTLGDHKVFRKGYYRSPYSEEFSKHFEVKKFEKMVVAYLNKYNDVDYSYEDYIAQIKGKKPLDISGSLGSYSDKQKAKKLRQIQEDEEFYQKMNSKGDAWSQDYSDEELSEYLNRMSESRERIRRNNLRAYHFNYQTSLSLGLNLVNNENLSDSDTSEQSKYSGEFGFEGFFFKDIDYFSSLTLELSGRTARDAYFAGDLNVLSTEYSLAFQINYYAFNQPSTVNAPVVFLGFLYRYGLARLTNNSTDEEGNYNIQSMPGLRLGIKWNMESGYGFRLQGELENIQVSKIEKSDSEGVLPDETNYINGRLSLGLTKFF